MGKNNRFYSGISGNDFIPAGRHNRGHCYIALFMDRQKIVIQTIKNFWGFALIIAAICASYYGLEKRISLLEYKVNEIQTTVTQIQNEQNRSRSITGNYSNWLRFSVQTNSIQ